MSVEQSSQSDSPQAFGDLEPETAPPARANHPLLDLTLIVGSAILLTLAFIVWMKGAAPDVKRGGLATGNQAPPIVAAGWLNGELPTAAERQGKVLVVNAWFTTCPNCYDEAPHLIETYEAYRDRGVIFIGLTYEDKTMLPDIEQFLKETGIPWPNGYGALQTLINFETQYFPAAWVIAPDGEIVWNHDSPGDLADGIERALAKR